MRIAIASHNPTKVEAAQAALAEVWPNEFELVCHSVDSEVSDQPLGVQETYQGAYNRAKAVLDEAPDAELGIGPEGGLMLVGDKYVNFGIVVVLGRNGVSGLGFSQGHAIPASLVSAIEQGEELSDVVAQHYDTDTVTDRDCSGVITRGALPAAEAYRQPTLLALLDFQNESSR